MTSFRRITYGIFALYLLIFSLIRMDYISYSDLSYGSKFFFIVLILLIELGVLIYGSLIWEVKVNIDDVTSRKQLDTYRDALRSILIVSSIGILAIFIDVILLPSYYSGMFYNAILVTDVLTLVCLTKSLISYVRCALSV